MGAGGRLREDDRGPGSRPILGRGQLAARTYRGRRTRRPRRRRGGRAVRRVRPPGDAVDGHERRAALPQARGRHGAVAHAPTRGTRRPERVPDGPLSTADGARSSVCSTPPARSGSPMASTQLIMASAALPAFLLMRRLVTSRAIAFLVALLTMLVPWMAFSTVLLTEVVGYPAFLWALLAAQRTLAEPSPGRDAVAAAAIVVATAARPQFLVLGPVLVLAAVAHVVGFALAAPGDERRSRAVRRALARERTRLTGWGLGSWWWGCSRCRWCGASWGRTASSSERSSSRLAPRPMPSTSSRSSPSAAASCRSSSAWRGAVATLIRPASRRLTRSPSSDSCRYRRSSRWPRASTCAAAAGSCSIGTPSTSRR